MKKEFRDPLIAKCIAIAVLLLALVGDVADYSLLLRFVICGLSAYLAVSAYQQSKLNWVWILGALTVLYNPLFPIRLRRDVWSDVYVATIALMLFMMWLLMRANRTEKKDVAPIGSKEKQLASFLEIYVDKKKHDEIAEVNRCQCCGAIKLTQMAVFMENVSYLYQRSERRFEGYVCFPCMAMTFAVYEARTLLFTWWGFIGMLLGPGYLLWNLYEFLGRSYRFVTFKKVKST